MSKYLMLVLVGFILAGCDSKPSASAVSGDKPAANAGSETQTGKPSESAKNKNDSSSIIGDYAKTGQPDAGILKGVDPSKMDQTHLFSKFE